MAVTALTKPRNQTRTKDENPMTTTPTKSEPPTTTQTLQLITTLIEQLTRRLDRLETAMYGRKSERGDE